MTPAPRDVSVLIPAAGTGERLGLGPKALLPLAGRPLLDWVIDKVGPLGAEILVALPPGTAVRTQCRCITGGASRQESLRLLSQAATRPWVLVWDAARPFGSVTLGRAVLAAAASGGAAAAVLANDVPLVVPGLQAPIASGEAFALQTPQAFDRELLQAVTARAQLEGWAAQSPIQLLMRAGHTPALVPGEKLNLKVTTIEDWTLAQALTHLLV